MNGASISVDSSAIGSTNTNNNNMSNYSQIATTMLAGLTSRMPSGSDLRDQSNQIWSKSRPWAEFSNTAQMNIPTMLDLKERISSNSVYYLYNYLIILVVLSVLTVLVSPLSILGLFVIGSTYYFMYIMHADRPLQVKGMVLDSRMKGVALAVVSLVILYITGAGATFTTLFMVVAVISLAHMAIRKPPSEADFDTVYQAP